MTLREAERLGVMKELERKKLTYQEASEILNLSIRQTIRVMKRYKAEGAKGVISQKKGASSPRRYPLEKKIKSIALVKEYYKDFGPSFAIEKLKKNHNHCPYESPVIFSASTSITSFSRQTIFYCIPLVIS